MVGKEEVIRLVISRENLDFFPWLVRMWLNEKPGPIGEAHGTWRRDRKQKY